MEVISNRHHHREENWATFQRNEAQFVCHRCLPTADSRSSNQNLFFSGSLSSRKFPLKTTGISGCSPSFSHSSGGRKCSARTCFLNSSTSVGWSFSNRAR